MKFSIKDFFCKSGVSAVLCSGFSIGFEVSDHGFHLNQQYHSFAIREIFSFLVTFSGINREVLIKIYRISYSVHCILLYLVTKSIAFESS